VPRFLEDLYKLLGIKKDASDTEIKKAYREKARECHPDFHKDDPEKTKLFMQVNQAFFILSNPETKKQYDETGFASEITDKKKAATSILLGLFFGVVETDVADKNVDIIKVMEVAIGKEIFDRAQNIKKLEKNSNKLKKVGDKVKRKDGNNRNNIFLNAINDQIRKANQVIADIRNSIELHELALKMLKDYDFEVEQIMVYGIAKQGSTTTI